MEQESGLAAGSISDNISLGFANCTFDAVRAAAFDAAADDFIERLPNGYDYDVGAGGLGLSSGQRQRIAIARALVRDPAILILDEATSNLDPATERRVLAGILRHHLRRITIMATHRIAVASQAQRIVVLDRGQIVETGSPSSLLALNGVYAAMARATTTHMARHDYPDHLATNAILATE